MIRFIFRVLAAIALAFAVILAVIDATRSVAAGRIVVTPLAKSWAEGAPTTMESARTAVEAHAPHGLWDPIALTVLSLPGFVIFAVLALLLYAAGHRRRRGKARTFT